MKEAGVSAVLSFLFSGLGQIYNGQLKKGFTIIALSLISILVMLVGSIVIGYFLLFDIFELKIIVLGSILFVTGIAGIAVLGICSIRDAYKSNEKL